MSKIEFVTKWQGIETNPPEVRNTMAQLELHIGNINLMQNEDIWSQTIKDAALLSAYPLALWLVSSWWRLLWEPLSQSDPTTDWRMSHELGASNYGFVWPQIMFASDSELMHVWAVPSTAGAEQSIRYLNGLTKPAAVSLKDFENSTVGFITGVLSRLDATGKVGTDLSLMWEELCEERGNPEVAKYRRLEAELGFDPGECPESIMQIVLKLDKQMGVDTLSELAPVFGKINRDSTSLDSLEELMSAPGITGTPQIDQLKFATHHDNMPPWKRGVEDARQLRNVIGADEGAVDNTVLYDLLGVQHSEMDKWQPRSKRQKVSIAVPSKRSKELKYVPRKFHPEAKRFELARFVGDYLFAEEGTAAGEAWLTTTDLATSRQKYQRAFAAEFLCPIDQLEDFLQNDFSESAIDEAREFFNVSTTTVQTLLANNGLAPLFTGLNEATLPYRIGRAA